MSKCCICNKDKEDLVEFRYSVYSVAYEVCSDCVAIPGNIISDCDGVSLPAYDNVLVTLYDGDNDRHLAQPRSYFDSYTPDTSFTCHHCDNRFYNNGNYLEDFEETWCNYCASNNACWDDESGNWYGCEDNIPYDEDDEDRGVTRQHVETETEINGFRIFKGKETKRFLASPLVGIEFEHAPCRRGSTPSDNGALYNAVATGVCIDVAPWARMFVLHGDGSIKWMENYSSAEIVSMPSSGHILDKIINRFYEPFADGRFTPGPEHHSCGFHMHVASRYLFAIKRGLIPNPAATLTCMPINLLDNMWTICKEFISSTRRSNSYCNGPVGIRDKNMGAVGGKAMRTIFGLGGYPALSVRSFGTIEYRIWPSSNSIRNTKARAELSQKMTAFFDEALINADSSAYEYKPEMLAQVKAIADMCYGGARNAVPGAIQELFGLSDECTEDLARMSARFNPFSGKKTHFKFTDKQIACVLDEDSHASTEFSTGMKGDIKSLGDTTMSFRETGKSEDEYLAFGKPIIKCYPAATTGEMPETVAMLAKGEI